MKIELVCKFCDEKIEISKDLYDFLKYHLIIRNANSDSRKPEKDHYALRTTVESVTEEVL